MENWLRCKIRRGQFSGEYVVQGDTVDGQGFSLFAEPSDVRIDACREVGQDETTGGWIRVEVVDRQDGIVLVRLPSEALERGYFVSVRASDVKPQSEARRLEPA